LVLRVRSPEAVVDETASAYHRQGVRVIILEDDLFVLQSERKSVEHMNAITRATAPWKRSPTTSTLPSSFSIDARGARIRGTVPPPDRFFRFLFSPIRYFGAR
jgi:hypothetical protein